MKIDVLIVGSGLAGTLLHYTLKKNGLKSTIISEITRQGASKVAAGLMNPITGRYNTKTWLAEELFPFTAAFYSELQTEFEAIFYHQSPIYRPFANDEEKKKSLKKESDFYSLLEETPEDWLKHFPGAAKGGMLIEKGGWLDVKLLLNALHEKFIADKTLLDDVFNYEQLRFNDSTLHYKDIEFSKIIFCEGFWGQYNPWFKYLPFAPVKGEVLNLTTDETGFPDCILSKGLFVIPVDANTLKAGATYSWNDLSNDVTQEAYDTMTAKLSTMLSANYTVTKQEAGIRPATKDRRPFIGFHNERPQVAIFNGFGSKGCTLIPYFAAQMAKTIIKGKDYLDAEANIIRFSQ